MHNKKYLYLFVIFPLLLTGCENERETTIILARHAQTEANVAGYISGNKQDSPLTDLGKSQAEALGVALNTYNFDAFYASTLNRTLNTGKIALSKIQNQKTLVATRDSRLDELDFGNATGMTIAEATSQYGGIDFPTNFGPVNNQNYKPSFTNENTYAWYKRFNTCLEEIAQKEQGKTVLVVTHGAAYFWGQLKFGANKVFGLNNAGYAEIKYKNNVFELIAWHNSI